jgi:predicted DNA-binding transcriptional regulator YafY
MRNAEVIRQWQILREVEQRRGGITIHELASQVKVSTRTIRRDLQALQYAGFALYDEGEENETKHWRLDGVAFRGVQEGLSVADVAALYLSQSVLEGLSGWPLADELRAAVAKIERALNPRMREFLSTLPQVVGTKGAPRIDRPSRAYVDVTRRLFDAARDRRIIEMKYFSAASNRSKTYLAHPYRLELAQGGLYLAAWVPAYEAFRTFAVDRVERLSVQDDTFKRSRELPADLFGASMGVFVGDPIRVEIAFDAGTARFLRSRAWHKSQKLEDLPDGRVKMTLDVTDDWALRSWILGFGASARVLAPASLRDNIETELAKAAGQYRKS